MPKKREPTMPEKRRHFFEAAKWFAQAREKAIEWAGDDLMIGMDLSLNSTGIATCSLADFRKIVDGDWADPSAIKTMAARWPKDTTTRQKIAGLGAAMRTVMEGRKVFSIVYEAVTVTQDPASFKALALCNGALYMATDPETVIIPLYTKQIKKIAAGKSTKRDADNKSVAISKDEVIAGLNRCYNGVCDKLALKTDDEADALCALIANGYMAIYLESLAPMLSQEYTEQAVFDHEKAITRMPEGRDKANTQVLFAVFTSPTTWAENEHAEHKKVLASIKATRLAAKAGDGPDRPRKAASARLSQKSQPESEDLDMLSEL